MKLPVIVIIILTDKIHTLFLGSHFTGSRLSACKEAAPRNGHKYNFALQNKCASHVFRIILQRFLFYFSDVILFNLIAVSNDRKMRLSDWKQYKEGDRYFYAIGDDGKARLVDSRKKIKKLAIRITNHAHVGYWLYTRKNAEPKFKQSLIMRNETSVSRSNFDPEKMTVFLSHGWKGDVESNINLQMTEALLRYSDCNVIILDWSKVSKKIYPIARYAVPRVGKTLGQFIKWLSQDFGMSLDNIHLIGYSLGAHLVGNAGKELGGRAARITALDPANPLWSRNSKHRVDITDAQYVEVIHTNAHQFGFPHPCGHSDHYPNGGKRMPGCTFLDLPCHHSKAWEYMVASITNNQFYAHKCENVKQAFANKCTGPVAKMGNADIRSTQRGVYRVNTRASFPYV